MKKKKLLILVNYLSFFLSHRVEIAEAALQEGFEVFIGYGELRGADPKLLQQMGFKLNLIPMHPGSINFFKDLKTLYHIWKYFNKVQPDIVHLVTVKPYLYGGIISRLLGVKNLVTAVSGLGTLFIDENIKTKFIRSILYPLYKYAFNHKNQKIIVQNKDDLNTLVSWGVLKSSNVKLIKGSGVRLQNFIDLEEPSGIITVTFAGRLLKDKGVYEFITAAKILKKRGINARFFLAGDLDKNNPSGIKNHDLLKIKKENYVEFIGYQKNISSLYKKSHIVCLPSYREGLPKTLIEASAAGRAIVTTDVPGCRDAIIPNTTGILVPPKDSSKLADAIQWLINNPQKRISMGKAGRKHAEKEFPLEMIVKKHIEIYNDLISNKNNFSI
ncbi:glycosyltransferase family 4 protein [Candidatus Pelagibacter sp. HIMB1485]|uniref:glycosyltransferase family 4 protein n=1 Tax=Candidatus Pelagibacter sp. HIMB1485 TaxID=3415415 RepID=UPI003F86C96F